MQDQTPRNKPVLSLVERNGHRFRLITNGTITNDLLALFASIVRWLCKADRFEVTLGKTASQLPG